jgi:hypothetical protein
LLFALFSLVAVVSGFVGYVVGPSRAAGILFHNPNALPQGAGPWVGYIALGSAVLALAMRVSDSARRG